MNSIHDPRHPLDPGGLGDEARVHASETRLRLWQEHLKRPQGENQDLIDPADGFDALARSADTLDQWHANGRQDARPPGQLRNHPNDRVDHVRAGGQTQCIASCSIQMDAHTD